MLPTGGRLSLRAAWPTTWKRAWDRATLLGPGGRGRLPRPALTWEGGTRSKFFPSILRMCFRACEVIWCLRRKENWQPSRMQWKWLFTWLYLQPVDTAPSAVSFPRPAEAQGTDCTSGTVLGPEVWPTRPMASEERALSPCMAFLRGGLVPQPTPRKSSATWLPKAGVSPLA